MIQNIMRMKNYQNILQTSIIILIIGLNAFSIGKGIKLESGWGIILAMASLGALSYCIYLFKKLRQLDAEEENY